MAFFNYSTMQMTAKIVYYGPGLCGKTTNLQFIYDHTTNESRGDMVSLETQTDRTLFFDLLPMEVGSIAGFKTRIQLYTVPGQVFYNTTRKLVLKGVDGVVFVADSQRPMMSANREALDNLAENLSSLGLSIDSVPLVLQFNKRDLPDTATVDELRDLLHRHSWPMFEASAITGMGVVETLRGISKLTLLSLRKQLEASAAGHQPKATPPAQPPAAAQAPSRAAAMPAVAQAPPLPSPAPAAVPVPQPPPKPQPVTVSRDLRVELDPAGGVARRARIGLRLENAQGKEVGRLDDLEVALEPAASVDSLRLHLDVTLEPEE
jgi:signal recognition particle receptor subunit beta